MQHFLFLVVAVAFASGCSSLPYRSPAYSRTPQDFDDNRAIDESLKKLSNTTPWAPQKVAEWAKAWKTKCGSAPEPVEGETAVCHLNECDISLPNCRKDRVMIFRGESTRDRAPATAALLHLQADGSRFCGNGDCSMRELLQQLKEYVDLAGPMKGPVNQYTGLKIQSAPKSASIDPEGVPGISWKDLAPTTFIEKLSGLQTVGTIYFEDPRIGRRTVSPLVSWSLSPAVAAGYHSGPSETTIPATPNDPYRPARFLVASVPYDKIDRQCADRVPNPGEMIGTIFCPRKTSVYPEWEVDSVLFLAPEYFLYAMEN